MSFPVPSSFLVRGSAIAGLAGLYYLLAEISRHVAATPQDVTPVWFPDGVATAVVLICGNWILPGVFLGSCLANLWAFWGGNDVGAIALSALATLGIATGNTLGTGLGTTIFCRITQRDQLWRNPFDRPRSVVCFLGWVGLFGPWISATFGVFCLCLEGKVPWNSYGAVWLLWWVANISGIFIFTPWLLSWIRVIRQYGLPYAHERVRRSFQLMCKPLDPVEKWEGRSLLGEFRGSRFQLPHTHKLPRVQRVMEGVLLVAIVTGLSRTTFGQGYPFEYMLIPCLIWAAFRFGLPGATFLAAVVSTIAVLTTVRNIGVFYRPELNQSLMLLQAFVTVTILTTLLMAAAIAHQEKMTQILQQSEWHLREKSRQLEDALRELHRTQTQLIQGEKMASLGQLVAGIAHEINNPINFIYGNINYAQTYTQDCLHLIQLYQQTYPDPPPSVESELRAIDFEFVQDDLPNLLRSMQMGAERIREIVLSLRNFSRLDESATKLVNLHEGIDSTLLILQHRLKPKGSHTTIQVIKNYGTLPLVECYASQLNQVFMNILSNAIDALIESNPPTPWIRITTQAPADVQGKAWVRVAIANNGPPIPESVQAKLFDPFFTTKPINKGTGLGMAISYQIVTEKHQGRLSLHTPPDGGVEFHIDIPITLRMSVSTPMPTASPSPVDPARS